MTTDHAAAPTPTVHNLLGYRHPSGRWELFLEGQHIFAHSPDLEPQLRAELDDVEGRRHDVTLKFGYVVETLARILGHESIYTTDEWIDKADEIVGGALARLDKLRGDSTELNEIGFRLAVMLGYAKVDDERVTTDRPIVLLTELLGKIHLVAEDGPDLDAAIDRGVIVDQDDEGPILDVDDPRYADAVAALDEATVS